MGTYNANLFGTQFFGGGSTGSTLQGTRGRTIIYNALRYARIITRAGRTEGTDERNDGLHVLNALIDSWSIERLTIPSVQPATYEWTAAAASRTIGETGDFEAVRPIRILKANLVDGDTRTPLDLLTLDRWSTRSHCGLYYDEQSPVGTLYLWPVPSTTVQLEIYPWVPLTGFTDVDTELFLPPGYLRALEYNLSIALHERSVDAPPLRDTVLMNANQSKAAIKSFNSKTVELRCDPSMTGRGYYDTRTGGWIY